MTYGVVFTTDEGGLLASSDYPTLVRSGVVTGAGTGPTYTYAVTTSEYPVCFLHIPVGGYGSVLSITGSSNNWTVTTLASAAHTMSVFTPITSATNSYGVQTRNASGELTFDSAAPTLNVKTLAALTEGGSIPASGDMVSFTGNALQAVSGPAPGANQFGLFYFDVQNVMTLSSPLYPGFFRYGFVRVAYYQTNWSIYRAVAQRGSTAVQFAWALHKSGFWRSMYASTWVDYSLGYDNAIYGYYSTFPAALPAYVGEFTSAGTYPYTSSPQKILAVPNQMLVADAADYT